MNRVLCHMPDIREPRTIDEDTLLKLNNDHRVELSELTTAGLRQLLKDAWHARVVDDAVAMVVAFDQDTVRDSENYRWFAERFRRFVYIDRVVVEPAARGRGLGRQLYEDVISAARDADHTVLCAEVNIDPPNPASHALHEKLGFTAVGDAHIAGGKKSVRYYVLEL